MFIASCQVKNYKSFGASEIIRLAPGFNLIVGKNNAGKTAFIEALSHQFTDKPHRTMATIPYSNQSPGELSSISVTVGVSRKEAYQFFSQLTPILVPIKSPKDVQHTVSALRDYLAGSCAVRYDFDKNGFSAIGLEGFPSNTSSGQVVRVACEGGTEELYLPTDTRRLRDFGLTDFARRLAENCKPLIYLFRAERPNLGECASGTGSQLAPDARNLAEVLHRLQSNVQRFARFVNEVRTVLPDVKHISADLTSQQNVRLHVWPVDAETERQDLALPLSDCGTGVGQVIAMLYVVFTSDAPRILIIDEPQSFLHPDAIRKLFDVLKRYSQHQFIITTHSPAVVTAANPATVILLRLDAGQTKAEAIDVNETSELRLFLSEIGARLSDVFGADQILWVEGRTEEICLRRVVERISKKELLGVEIIGVTHVGELEGKHAKTVLEIYDRLCKGRGLLPPAIGFCFDREGRTADERKRLTQNSNGMIQFIPRRMYENYLLNPKAIASVLTESDSTRGRPIVEQEISEWLQKKGRSRAYLPAKQAGDWNVLVDAAKLLNDLFNEITETRVCYDKIKHGLKLTDWLIQNSPGDLKELAEFLTGILSK